MASEALLLVDVQNDFCPGGALPVPEGDRIVPVLNRYIDKFHSTRLPIFASRDWHPPITKHFKAYGGNWPPHCVQGTRGAQFHPHLALPKDVEVVSKGMNPEKDSYSSFQAFTADGTDFSTLLKERGIQQLFVGGLATDYCVKQTVLDALREGFGVVLLEDAVRGVDLNSGDSEKALEEMRKSGARRIRFQQLTLR
ncbi:MAG: bifunctional nicotinamidase/pyrazinamidase [Candidatus Omnitrophica bacterium]|nr:bifunctional nicotinamidase/pyrazinamidase [Candidatus Omnitrophota bacterium]